jgi:outer membrane protein OmpA-like peptidoglycan-associated protein
MARYAYYQSKGDQPVAPTGGRNMKKLTIILLAVTIMGWNGFSIIKPDSHSLLDEYGKALNGKLSDVVVAIAGHTDSKGTDDYNMGLSEKRANAIKDYLISKHGISPERVVVKAYGKSKPVASNDTTDGQALNRRVEFIRLGAI